MLRLIAAPLLYIRKSNHKHSDSQRVRYEYVTKRIFLERIKAADNRYLRNIDITLENGKTARLVRRIVEKRMSQACHRQYKNFGADKTNRTRHRITRAVSYQLYNIGQIDNCLELHRDVASHWKYRYDHVTSQFVLKKKVEYATLQDANLAIIQWQVAHSNDKTPMVAYKCSHCHYYHIGHSIQVANFA